MTPDAPLAPVLHRLINAAAVAAGAATMLRASFDELSDDRRRELVELAAEAAEEVVGLLRGTTDLAHT